MLRPEELLHELHISPKAAFGRSQRDPSSVLLLITDHGSLVALAFFSNTLH